MFHVSSSEPLLEGKRVLTRESGNREIKKKKKKEKGEREKRKKGSER